jgi:RNA polymerase sigma-70 factor (ECF subfamily)
VLIQREVLGYSARETADSLETSVASVNSALQRARSTVDEKLPEQSQQATLRSLGDQKLQQIVERYMDAMGRGDVEQVVSMLTEEAAWSMPPLASWFRGRDALRVFLRKGPLSGAWRWRRLPARANGQLAVAAYTWREDEGAFRPFALDVLTLDGDRISDVTAFLLRSSEPGPPERFVRYPDEAIDDVKVASTFTRLGLPERLD